MGFSMTRRGALVAAAAAVAALAGCASEAPRAPAPSEPPSPPPPPPSPASPSATVPPPPAVDPAAVAARHEGARGTAWGMDLPGIVSTLAEPVDAAGRPRIALTFDACGTGGDGVDARLLDGLRDAGIPATLFLNARWIRAHPDLAADLAADPLFVLANHGTDHLPLSVDGASAYGIRGTVSAAAAVEEVWGNHVLLTELTGAEPRYFRAGTAHYDDVAVQIVRELGELPVGFSINGDGGATFGEATVAAEIGRAGAGAIVLAHMNRPGSGTAVGALRAAETLRAGGAVFTHLDF